MGLILLVVFIVFGVLLILGNKRETESTLQSIDKFNPQTEWGGKYKPGDSFATPHPVTDAELYTNIYGIGADRWGREGDPSGGYITYKGYRLAGMQGPNAHIHPEHNHRVIHPDADGCYTIPSTKPLFDGDCGGGGWVAPEYFRHAIRWEDNQNGLDQ